MKNLIMNHQQSMAQQPQANQGPGRLSMSMGSFFEFVICLLRNIPQHENLLRFLVFN